MIRSLVNFVPLVNPIPQLRAFFSVGASALLLTCLLSACGSARYVPDVVTPYRPDIQQGNWITQQQAAQLATGMTRDQVRFVLGSPLLTDVFHDERWDYLFLHQRGKGKQAKADDLNDPDRPWHFTVFFENDRVTRWAGDPLPNGQPFSASTTSASAAETPSQASSTAPQLPVSENLPGPAGASSADTPLQNGTSVAPAAALQISPGKRSASGFNRPAGDNAEGDSASTLSTGNASPSALPFNAELRPPASTGIPSSGMTLPGNRSSNPDSSLSSSPNDNSTMPPSAPSNTLTDSPADSPAGSFMPARPAVGLKLPGSTGMTP